MSTPPVTVHPTLPGKYECELLQKNDWHYVTITEVDDTTLKWSNRAGVMSWTLETTPDRNELVAADSSPDKGRKTTVTWDGDKAVALQNAGDSNKYLRVDDVSVAVQVDPSLPGRYESTSPAIDPVVVTLTKIDDLTLQWEELNLRTGRPIAPYNISTTTDETILARGNSSINVIRNGDVVTALRTPLELVKVVEVDPSLLGEFEGKDPDTGDLQHWTVTQVDETTVELTDRAGTNSFTFSTTRETTRLVGIGASNSLVGAEFTVVWNVGKVVALHRTGDPQKQLTKVKPDEDTTPVVQVPPSTGPWSPFANGGLDGVVHAFAFVGNALYVGGMFSETADGKVKKLGNIAKYSNGAWSALQNGGLKSTDPTQKSSVTALAVVGSDLYVGGNFHETADGKVKELGQIAKYSNGKWEPLASGGLWGNVYALAFVGGDLYLGGGFTTTADVKGDLKKGKKLGNIAKYANGTWSPLANDGLKGQVYALAVKGSDLYVGGNFHETADGEVRDLGGIAKCTNGKWTQLENGGLNKSPCRLAVLGDDLYLSGWFTATADDEINDLAYIARYSKGKWSPLENGGLNATADAVACVGNDLYVGGKQLSETGDGQVKELGNIAKYANGQWSPLSNGGLSGAETSSVSVIAIRGSDLFVGGYFSETADGNVKDLGNIVKYSIGT